MEKFSVRELRNTRGRVLQRWRRLPLVDVVQFQADLDHVMDASR